MINIAELLKDAPKGMKLYSPLFGEVEYMQLGDENKVWVKTSCGTYYFDKYGKPYAFDKAECLLFPSKDCRTWEGWELLIEPKFKVNAWIISNTTKDIYQVKAVPEYFKLQAQGQYRLQSYTDGSIAYFWKNDVENTFHLWTMADAKDGDVLATDNGWTCIFKAFDECMFSSYCFMDSQKWFCELGSEAHTLDSRINGNIHPATKEQRDLLFAKMKEADYTWDSGKKELKKIPKHYDIANFQPKQWVLVRDRNDGEWNLTMFSYLHRGSSFLFICINGVSFKQCIPLEGNEKLLGTTDMPSEEYINWKT